MTEVFLPDGKRGPVIGATTAIGLARAAASRPSVDRETTASAVQGFAKSTEVPR